MKQFSLPALALVFLATSAVEAQQRPRDAGSKARGEVNSFWVGSTRQRHAYDHARVMNQVVRGAPAVEREIVQGHANAMRAHSQAAMKEFTALKGNKAIADSLEKLQKHHQQVIAMCDMLDECCKKPEAEGTVVMDCCKNAMKELAAAEKEAEKIRETLKIPPLADAAESPQGGSKR